MAWIATLVDKKAQRDGTVKLVMEYVDGPRTINKEYTFFGDFDIQNVVYNEIAGFEKLRAAYTALAVESPVTGVATSVVSATPKSQFLSNVGRLGQYKNLIDLGVISSVNSDYVALKSSVASGFDSSYI